MAKNNPLVHGEYSIPYIQPITRVWSLLMVNFLGVFAFFQGVMEEDQYQCRSFDPEKHLEQSH